MCRRWKFTTRVDYVGGALKDAPTVMKALPMRSTAVIPVRQAGFYHSTDKQLSHV